MVTLDEHNKFRIYPIGDMHLTLRTFQQREFRRYIKTIEEDPAGIAIIMGDVTDARSRDHKFFAPEMVASRYHIEDIDILEDKAAEEAAELLAPIADKLAGIITGNHHKKGFTHSLRREIRHLTGQNPPDLGNRAMIRLKCYTNRSTPEFSLSIFATHRDSGGKKPGSQLNNEVDNLISWDADVFLFAHSHRSSYYRQPRAELATRGSLKLKRRDALFINAGAWLEVVSEGTDSYPDEKNLPLQNDDKYYAEVTFKAHQKETRIRQQTWE